MQFLTQHRLVHTSSLILSILSIATTTSAQSTTDSSPSVPTDLPTPWRYEGCFTDSPQARALTNTFTRSNTSMTAEYCINYCTTDDNASSNFPYIALSYGTECFCGYTIATTSTNTNNNTLCNYPCSGSNTESCGGSDHVSLYTNPTLTIPSVNPGVNNWISQGCYNDTPTSRILSHSTISATNMTVAVCTAYCRSSGMNIAGLEFGRECHCDNDLRNAATTQPESQCNFPCVANSSEFCGGNGRANVYRFNGSASALGFSGESRVVMLIGLAVGLGVWNI